MNAIRVLIEPVSDEVKSKSDFEGQLKGLLTGKEIIEGYKIYADIEGQHVLFLVKETEPKGKVTVTQETFLEALREPEEQIGELEENKVIKIRNLPDLSVLKEVEDLGDIWKIAAAGNLVDRYEDHDRLVYTSAGYYYLKRK